MGSKVNFDDQVVIISGAGRRLGRLYARALAELSAKVIVNDIEADRAGRVVAEIEAAGGTAVPAVASVTTEEGAASIVETAIREFGTVDALIANAGFMRSAYLEETSEEMLNDVLSIHIGGSFHLARAVWPIMKSKGYGRVVMTCSSSGMFASKGACNYSAAKAGIYGLTRCLAFEGEEHGIRVNCVLPHANPLADDNPEMSAEDNAKWYDDNWSLPDHQDYFDDEIAESFGRRDASLVTPMTAYLASAACTVTGEAYAAGFGRFARVFVAESSGWRPDTGVATADAIATNLETIRSPAAFDIPANSFEEGRYLARIKE